MELFEQLQRQLGFLRRSCELYDAGHKDESLRLSVVIRTLVHDTHISTSLLKQMGIKDRLHFDSSLGFAARLPPGFQPTMILPIMLTSAGEGVTAAFNGSSPNIKLSINDWWEEIVMKQEHSFTRKDVVLSAANQDGGAHVDEFPSDRTKELREDLARVMSVKVNGIEVNNLENHHFPLIRQFAHEIFLCDELNTISEGSRPTSAFL